MIPAMRVHASTALLLVVSWVVYFAVGPTGTPWGDGADLVRAALTEAPQPFARSYPVQSLLIAAANWLLADPGTAAVVVASLGSALAVAATHAVATRLLGLSAVAGLTAAAAMFCNHSVWVSAADAEVYGLFAVQSGVTLGVVIAAPSRSRALIAGALMGTALLHHRVASALILVAPLAIALTTPRDQMRAALRDAAIGCVPGIVVTALLVSAAAPGGLDRSFVRSWLIGAPSNATFLLRPIASLGERIAYVVKWIAFDTAGIVAVLGVLGLPAFVRRLGRRRAVCVGALVALSLAMPLQFDGVGDRHVFLVALYPVVAVSAGCAVQALNSGRARMTAAAAVLVVPLVVFGVAASRPVAPRLLPGLTRDAATEFLLPIRCDSAGSSAWAREVLRIVPDGQIVHAEWGAAAALELVQRLDGVRPDVTVVRGLPSGDALAEAGEGGAWCAMMPIWADPRSRLPSAAASTVAGSEWVFHVVSEPLRD